MYSAPIKNKTLGSKILWKISHLSTNMAKSDNHTGPGTCGSPCLAKFLFLSWLSHAYNNAAPGLVHGDHGDGRGDGWLISGNKCLAGEMFSYLLPNFYILRISLHTPCYCINSTQTTTLGILQ